jgi:phosphinothricin acetyltransferase
MIRTANQNDLPMINDIYNEAVLTTIATFDTIPKTIEERKNWYVSRSSKHSVIVCELENQVVGWASLNVWSDRTAYNGTVENSVYILEKYRGKGYGTLLLGKLIELGKENNFHTIISRITDGNQPSIKLHERFGFEYIGNMKEVGYKFDRWIDVTMMQKML